MDRIIGKITPKGIITKEYSWFVPDKTNRLLTEENLKKLENDLNSNATGDSYPFQAPVVVYWVEGMNFGRIQQGHHRFEFCVRNNKEVNFIVTDCYRFCSQGHEKTGQDYKDFQMVWSYKKQEKESYVLLWELMERFPDYAPPTLTIFINGKMTTKPKIRDGYFKLKADYETSKVNALKRIELFEEFCKAAKRTDRPKELIRALFDALEYKEFDWNYFIKRCKANADEVNSQLVYQSITSSARAKLMITRLYNLNSHKNFEF